MTSLHADEAIAPYVSLCTLAYTYIIYMPHDVIGLDLGLFTELTSSIHVLSNLNMTWVCCCTIPTNYFQYLLLSFLVIAYLFCTNRFLHSSIKVEEEDDHANALTVFVLRGLEETGNERIGPDQDEVKTI